MGLIRPILLNLIQSLHDHLNESRECTEQSGGQRRDDPPVDSCRSMSLTHQQMEVLNSEFTNTLFSYIMVVLNSKFCDGIIVVVLYWLPCDHSTAALWEMTLPACKHTDPLFSLTTSTYLQLNLTSSPARPYHFTHTNAILCSRFISH